jgi:hypothetical protein
MAMEKIRLCESLIGYNFNDPQYGAAALYTFPSWCPELKVNIDKNDTMAVLRDAALQQQLCLNWHTLGLSKGRSYAQEYYDRH